MESTRDQTRAFLYAIGVHLIAGVMLFSGLLFNRPMKPVLPSGDTLEAVLIDMTLGQPAARPTPSRPPPKPEPPKPEPPKPQPKPEPAPPPVPPQATPDDVTDQRIVPPSVPDTTAMDLERRLEEVRREQERARAQTAELERQRQQQVEDRRRAEAEAERIRQDALRAQQILNQSAEPAPVGNPRPGVAGGEDSLAGQYAALLREVIRQRWRRPAGTPVGIRCVVQVRQIPGGEVMSAAIGRPCNADEIVQRSILDAVERASPLPYEGFESVYNPRLELTFEYNGDM